MSDQNYSEYADGVDRRPKTGITAFRVYNIDTESYWNGQGTWAKKLGQFYVTRKSATKALGNFYIKGRNCIVVDCEIKSI